MGDSKSLIIIFNHGLEADKQQALHEKISAPLQEAGYNLQFIRMDGSKSSQEKCEKLIKQSKPENAHVVAVGGDGTVNFVAGLCYRYDMPMGIIPLGTFNYFARDLQIPLALEDAIANLVNGTLQKVSIGMVNDHVFLNNASFGLYTKIIRDREEVNLRFGRLRLVAAISAMIRLFKKQRLLHVHIISDGKEETHLTPMIFVGNNTFQLNNLGLDPQQATNNHQLAVLILKEGTRLHMLRLIILGIFRNMHIESNLEEFYADKFDVNTRKKSLDLVLDGEILHCTTPLSFEVKREALTVITPRQDADAQEAL